MVVDRNEDPPFPKRRKHMRKPYFSVVDYSIQDTRYTDFIHNISAGGVFIGTGTPFLAGEQVSMVFPLPVTQEQFRIAGEIVWASKKGIGVRFKMTDDKREATIQSLVDMI